MNYEKIYQNLNKNAKSIVIQPNAKLIEKPMTIFKGFIGSNIIIKPYSNPNSGFKADDEELYHNFIALASTKERNLTDDINLIQQYIDQYFGNRNEVTEIKNANPNIHSIKAYQNHGGECIQKSVIANNLLQILGYDCEMIWSNIGSENHAFLIINYQDKHFIYDPANHSKLFISDQQFYKIPTLIEKSKEDINNFYRNKNPLTITEDDEIAKNLKQTNSNFKIVLPKLTYSCRNKTEYINLTKEKDIVEDYIEHLKAKGLTDNDIKNILKKIKMEAINGIKPKVEGLDEIYNAMKAR